MKGLVIIALTLVAVWTCAIGTNVRDSVVLRVFNKNLKISLAEMQAILKKANLEGHGYELEVITHRPGSKKTECTKTYYYYKVVPCHKAYEVEQELDRLLGGKVLGAGVARKTKKDLEKLKIENPSKTCKTGIEIDFKNQQDCSLMANDDDLLRRDKRVRKEKGNKGTTVVVVVVVVV